jgi:hypothetical protein
MGPTIQLIQLTLRVEREAKIQRRSSMAYRDELVDERTVHPPKQDNRIKDNFNLLHRRQQCECA